MTEGNFVDYASITIFSGKGGNGSSHMRREKYVPKGGPDGGDGGRGGHIVIKANKNIWTLYGFKFKRHFKAGNGKQGGKSRKSGAQGTDLTIQVPIGTTVKDTLTNEILMDIHSENHKEILLHGGHGGKGNWHYKSSVNQSPRFAQDGLLGSERKITLELKILADVGLVGLPNAGKSTLLSSLSNAKPKIADYEFTTLKPNLGIVPHRDYNSFVMADIPGIIEGAADGKGLGHRFLRHVERNSVLLFVISVEKMNPKKEFMILQKELKKYNRDLLDKRFAIAFTKADMFDDILLHSYQQEISTLFDAIPHFVVSSLSGYNLNELKDGLWKLLQ